MKKQVYEITIKVFLINNINKSDAAKEIAKYIDCGMGKNDEFLRIHKEKNYKPYTFNLLYPVPVEDGIYKKENIYSVQIRTIDYDLAKFFSEELVNKYTNSLKGLTSEVKIIPRKHIEKLYSMTPVLLKNNGGYWKRNLSMDQFEKRLIDNIIKKYNYIYKTEINEEFQFYTSITFNNKKPISINYKNIKLLGDKVELIIDNSQLAQDLAYLSLGVGLLESNSRGFGFVGYRWL